MTDLATIDASDAERRALRIGLRLDAIADNYQAVMPMIRESIDLGDHLTLGYRSPGEYLMERFGKALAHLPIPVRRAAVKELAASGLSTRAIAPIVGVDQKTVSNDQRAVAGEESSSPEPAPEVDLSNVDRETGEILDGPFDAERVVAESIEYARNRPQPQPDPTPSKVTGIDGKEYTRPEPKQRLLPRSRRTDVVAEISRALEAVESAAERAARIKRSHLTHRQEEAAIWSRRLSVALEQLEGLNNRLQEVSHEE